MTPRYPDISPLLARTYLAVVGSKSFTDAARRLNLQQSTVSQHVKRLEALVGQRLLERDTHSVRMTIEGEAMRELAQNLIEANQKIGRHFYGTEKRTLLRLGISEDFAVSELAEVLRKFQREYGNIDLQLIVGLSGALYQFYDSGELDVLFAKRKPGDTRGVVAWKERLAWIGAPGFKVSPDAPIPLVAYTPPSITRSMAISALEDAGLHWRMACSSVSLNGLRAAASAGLGVIAHSSRLIPPGLVLLEDGQLPKLGTVEFVALGRSAGGAATALIKALVTYAGVSDEAFPNAR